VQDDQAAGGFDSVVAVACEGHVTRRDCEDVLIPAVQATLRRHPKLRLYYEVTPQFSGIDAAIWEDFRLGMQNLSRWGTDGRGYRCRVDSTGDERLPLSAAGPAVPVSDRQGRDAGSSPTTPDVRG
jgi:hypothetical protein